MGIPFYRGTLAGDLIFSFALFGAHALAVRLLFQSEARQEVAL
jgi:hypothetical protein